MLFLYIEHKNYFVTNFMFCWPCIRVYQYSETKVMHFLFNLLRIKDLYMFRALFAHPQEALDKRHLVYCVRIISVDCGTVAVQLKPCNILNVVCLAPPEDEQVMLETCRGPRFSINWMKSASRWFHYTDILWRTISKTFKFVLQHFSDNWHNTHAIYQAPLVNKQWITLVSLYWYFEESYIFSTFCYPTSHHILNIRVAVLLQLQNFACPSCC
jgi:hypothetical protein